MRAAREGELYKQEPSDKAAFIPLFVSAVVHAAGQKEPQGQHSVLNGDQKGPKTLPKGFNFN